MLTFEIILNAFSDYLEQDDVVEVVSTSRGYTVMMWDRKQNDWWNVEYCGTPERMMDVMLNAYGMYLEERCCGGKHDLTATEKAEIRTAQEKMKALCKSNEVNP